MTAVAKMEAKPTLRTIARGALIKCGGDANRATKAVVAMLKRVLRDLFAAWRKLEAVR
jgi:hypothetical protein